MATGYFAPQIRSSSSKASSALSSVGALYMGLSAAVKRLDVLVGYIPGGASDLVDDTALNFGSRVSCSNGSENPVSPSTDAIRISCTPRLFQPV